MIRIIHISDSSHAASSGEFKFKNISGFLQLIGRRTIFVNAKVFQAYYAFCMLLTDYIDGLFATRFEYERVEINPASA
jgi:hypothetical protein